MRDHSFFAADAYDERLTLHARDGVHARYLQEIGDVFGVVYLVKERLLIGVHIHGGDEYIFGFERHLILHLHGSAFRSLAGWVRECTQPRFHRDIEGIRGERLIGVSGVSQGKLVASEVHRVAGEIALKSPKPDAAKAEAYFERALAVARQQQAKSWELRAAMSIARLWRDRGKRKGATDLLAPVYGWFTEGFDTLDLKEAKNLLDELSS
jgi:hypothetical protein